MYITQGSIATYQERADEWNDTTIRSKTVGDGTHGVFTDTIPDVCAGVVAEASAGRLEVDSALHTRQVAASQIGGTTKQVGENGGNGRQRNLGELTRCLGGVRSLVDGK